MNPKIDFQSRIGINGILKKIAALMLLIFFYPVSNDYSRKYRYRITLCTLLWIFINGNSINIRKLSKIGIDVSLFQNFINRYSKSTMDNNKTNNSNEKEKKEEK